MTQDHRNNNVVVDPLKNNEDAFEDFRLLKNDDYKIQNNLYFTSGYIEKCTATFLIEKLAAINSRIAKNNAEIKNISQKIAVYETEKSELKSHLDKFLISIKDEQKMIGATPDVIKNMEIQLQEISTNLQNLNQITELKLDGLDIEQLCIIYNKIFSIPVKEHSSRYDTIASINQYLPEKITELKKLQASFMQDIQSKTHWLQAQNDKITKLLKESHLIEDKIETVVKIIQSFEHDINHINADNIKQLTTASDIHIVLDSD
jgi:chromosome segregation ATPase